MNLLFVDPKSSTPYDGQGLRREAVGGTEASLVTVAEGLASVHAVAVEQLGRSRPAEISPGVRYLPLDTPDPFAGEPADAVVILRRIRLASRYRQRFPDSRLHVWVHNWQRPEVMLKRAVLARTRCSVIAVSDALARASDRLINGVPARLLGTLSGCGSRVPIRRIYNPVDDRLQVEPVPVDHDRMIFFSTPNKGLRRVLEAFLTVQRELPAMQLAIAGSAPEVLEQYVPGCTTRPGIRVLGRLPRDEVLRHVRESLCVFYPQDEHPETFGLVFAEANAVGTPVLAHDFGAAAEILGDPVQLVDARDHAAIVARVVDWRSGGRPRVGGRPDLRRSAVLGEWRRLLEAPVGFDRP
ncbi:glycosyl transferase group 1 [Thioalkalivibrio nitratireducens DSM 14787]|uniref:Glycosyl transferase group 1 n=1 Tax=Thioalkalivibrio nitratireducens (strain DSM 14787 / UNIQEM 213 / ALEN2) TaxID=1255043 RepID=L0DXQ0_THIND|nr:glycosyltransferase [Thioalkalivibrio nitratireducens]AGA33818.1 glycosyl transferase group 1 [Thioalkalivibrio nitratireducens DSM 14787]